MGRKSYIDKGLISYESLYQLYVVQSLSVQAIAKTLSVSTGVVHKYLKYYEIPRRSRGNRLSKGVMNIMDLPRGSAEVEAVRKMTEKEGAKSNE